MDRRIWLKNLKMPSDADRNGLNGSPAKAGAAVGVAGPSSQQPPSELVKYGELIILGYNGQLPQGRAPFVCYLFEAAFCELYFYNRALVIQHTYLLLKKPYS